MPTLLLRSSSACGNFACDWLARKSLKLGLRSPAMLWMAFSSSGSQETTRCRFFSSSQSPASLTTQNQQCFEGECSVAVRCPQTCLAAPCLA